MQAGGSGAPACDVVLHVVADVLELVWQYLVYPAGVWLVRDSRRALVAAALVTVACWRTPLWVFALYWLAFAAFVLGVRFGPTTLRRYAREHEPRRRT
ncbi:MAG: hypothetical protein H5T97_04000, partial [Firmicutes bacterium]|nr:hypothetical protein [Bacillota bacterium]